MCPKSCISMQRGHARGARSLLIGVNSEGQNQRVLNDLEGQAFSPSRKFHDLPPPPISKLESTIKNHEKKYIVMPAYLFLDTLCWRLLVFVHQPDRYMRISTTAAMY
jgi:hypothetical protein